MTKILAGIVAAVAVAAVIGYLTKALIDERVLRITAEQSLDELGRTLEQERDRYEQTDSMLAESVRQSRSAAAAAAKLAKELEEIGGCADTRIDAAVVERVLEYRGGQVSSGASATGVD